MSSDLDQNLSMDAPSAEAHSTQEAVVKKPGRFGFLSKMTIFDTMLVTSAICITVACMLLVLELSTFSDGFFNQWRTGEAFVEPLRP